MSKKGSAVKAGLGYTIGNILIKGITFLSLPLFSRLLNTTEFGVFNTYIAYESILTILFGLGLYASIKNAEIDFEGRLQEYITTILLTTLVPLALFLILLVCIPGTMETVFKMDRYLILLLCFHSYGNTMLQIINAKFALQYEYKKYLKYAVFNSIGNVLLSVVLIVTVCSNSRGLGRIIGSATPFILIGIYVFISELMKSRLTYDQGMGRYALKIGTPLIAHYLSQQVQNQFDRIAITRLINSAATGIYSFAYTIANILQIIFYSINNVFTVWSYERLKAQEYERLRTCAKKYIALMVFLTIGLMSISKELIMIAGHSSYWEGQYVFLPITVGIFLLFLYTIPVIIEYYFKETKYIALMTCIAAGVNIVTNYIFIPKYGYIAAAYTTMLSYGVQFTAHWFISLQIMKKYGLPQIYKFTDFLAPFAEVSLAALAISYLNGYPVIKYCALLIYIALMFCKYREDITVIIKKHFLKGGI